MTETCEIEIPYEVLMECLSLLTAARIVITVKETDNNMGLVTAAVTYHKLNTVHVKALDKVSTIVISFTELLTDRYSQFPTSIDKP